MRPDRGLAGSVAIVTGGARGQGEAEARLLAAHGAFVVIGDILDREGQDVAASLQGAACYQHLDVTSPSDWQLAVEAAASQGDLRVLVNNAAIHRLGLIENESVEEFYRLLSVNLVGPFLGIQAVLEPMTAAGGGSIINIASIAGLAGFPGQAIYGSTKWGLRGLTKTASLELGSRRIRVNAILPGPINTAMLPGGDRADRHSRLALGRAGEASEVAAAVVFLASDESSYITGAEITVDGGASAGRVKEGPRTVT